MITIATRRADRCCVRCVILAAGVMTVNRTAHGYPQQTGALMTSTRAKRQAAVTAHSKSKQLLLFALGRWADVVQMLYTCFVFANACPK